MADLSAAIVAGAVSLVVGFTTAYVTMRQAGVDEKLAQLRGTVDQGIAQLRGDVDERIAQQKLSIEQQEANRRPFLQKQLELCFEATDVASRLAAETNPAEWEKSRFDFWRLYWGILGIVEDEAVARAMVSLGNTVPVAPVASPALPMTSLKTQALALAHAARDLMRKSWHVELPEITLARPASTTTP